ncbi:MAG: hypothetical protein ABIH66_08595 [bacterium]
MILPPYKIDSLSWTMGKISAQAELVKRGVRPVAEITVHKDCFQAAIEEVERFNLYTRCIPKGENHTEIYLFQHSHLGNVVEYLNDNQESSEIFFAWCCGKLFGYSEYQIGEFIERNL